MEWCRLWHDMPSDLKWATIARKSGRSVSEVIAVYTFLMVSASKSEIRGSADDFSVEDVACFLGIDDEAVKSILGAMQGKVLEGMRLTGWEKRQPKREDHSTERVRKHRETQCNALKRKETPREDTDTDTDKDKEQNTPPISPPGEDSGETFQDESSLSGDEERIPYQQVLDEYNRLCVNMPRAEVLTDDRRQSIRARIKECKKLGGIEAVFQVFRYACQSPHHNGENDKGWRADFDWLIGPRNFRKMLERARSGTKPVGAGNGQRAPTGHRILGEDMPEL